MDDPAPREPELAVAQLEYRAPQPQLLLPRIAALLGFTSLLSIGGSCLLAAVTGDERSWLIFPIGSLAGIAALIVARVFWQRKTELVLARDRKLVRVGAVMGGLAVAATLYMIVTIANAPSLSRSREAASRIRCGSNLRQIGQALRQYERAYGMRPPDLSSLAVTGLVPAVFLCPNAGGDPAEPGDALVYGQNVSYVILNDAATSTGDPLVIVALQDPNHHQRDGSNVLYADGSVRFLQWEELAYQVQTLQAEGRWPFLVDPTPFLQPDRKRRSPTTQPAR